MTTKLAHGDRVSLSDGDEDSIELSGNVVEDQAAWFTHFGTDNKMQSELSGKAPDVGMVAVLWENASHPTWIYADDLTIVWRR